MVRTTTNAAVMKVERNKNMLNECVGWSKIKAIKMVLREGGEDSGGRRRDAQKKEGALGEARIQL